MEVQDDNFAGKAVGRDAIEQLGQVYLEKQRTKRLLIGAACLFFIVGALLMVFAPEGRETVSTIIGLAMLIMSLGAIGVAVFRIKLPGIEVEADRQGLEQDR